MPLAVPERAHQPRAPREDVARVEQRQDVALAARELGGPRAGSGVAGCQGTAGLNTRPSSAHERYVGARVWQSHASTKPTHWLNRGRRYHSGPDLGDWSLRLQQGVGTAEQRVRRTHAAEHAVTCATPGHRRRARHCPTRRETGGDGELTVCRPRPMRTADGNSNLGAFCFSSSMLVTYNRAVSKPISNRSNPAPRRPTGAERPSWR